MKPTQDTLDRAYEHYLSHIKQIVDDCDILYPPSQEMANTPEKWNDAHWSWFIHIYYKE